MKLGESTLRGRQRVLRISLDKAGTRRVVYRLITTVEAKKRAIAQQRDAAEDQALGLPRREEPLMRGSQVARRYS